MTVTYRDATPDDAETLDALFDAIFCATFAHLYREEDLAAFLSGFSLEDWRERLANPAHAVRIAEVDGKPVGYVKLGPMKLPIEPSAPAMLLEQLYVLNQYHGAGIAAGLIDWALDEARRRDARELYLTVFIDNHRARRFYDRYGFEAVGKYDFMVGSQADEDIIMRKML